jgi:hypothetical protein
MRGELRDGTAFMWLLGGFACDSGYRATVVIPIDVDFSGLVLTDATLIVFEMECNAKSCSLERRSVDISAWVLFAGETQFRSLCHSFGIDGLTTHIRLLPCQGRRRNRESMELFRLRPMLFLLRLRVLVAVLAFSKQSLTGFSVRLTRLDEPWASRLPLLQQYPMLLKQILRVVFLVTRRYRLVVMVLL